MHQQPPKTPLLRSTSAANASQVDSSSARTVYLAMKPSSLTSREREIGSCHVTIQSDKIAAVDDDRVFKALADPTRRHLLDQLFEQDGRTLGQLEEGVEMTRFGVMKHLRVLEDAGLVVTRRAGREKHHFLNPVPIRELHDRWIDKYTERRVSTLLDLKAQLEETA